MANQHSKSSRTRISVVLAARNEEANINQCLESVRGLADEIIVADEQSTDATPSIAKKFKAKVISVPHQDNFHITKNIAIDAAHGDWILQLDADEVVSPELAREIQSHLEGGNMNGYWINRKNWFLTRFLTKGGQYPDPTLRLYRRGKGRLPAVDVHEQAVVDGPVGHLQHDLLHYHHTTFSKYMDGLNRYSSFAASQMQDHNDPLGVWPAIDYLVIKPASTFLNIYFRHLGIVDGYPGFIFAFFSGLTHAVAYIKYWQRSLHD